MPKLRKLPEQILAEARESVTREIRVGRADLGLSQHDVAQELGLADSRLSLLLKDVDKFRPTHIRKLVQMRLLSPVTVLRWLGYTDKEIKSINLGT